MSKKIKLDRPRILIDFNEFVENDLYLLSKTDLTFDSEGTKVEIIKDNAAYIYSDDCGENDDGVKEVMIADGTAELNDGNNWAPHVKWCIRLDQKGVRYELLQEI